MDIIRRQQHGEIPSIIQYIRWETATRNQLLCPISKAVSFEGCICRPIMLHLARQGCPNSKTRLNAAEECNLNFPNLKAALDGSFMVGISQNALWPGLVTQAALCLWRGQSVTQLAPPSLGII